MANVSAQVMSASNDSAIRTEEDEMLAKDTVKLLRLLFDTIHLWIWDLILADIFDGTFSRLTDGGTYDL